MTDTEKAKKTRQIFIVSDGTAITAETLAHSILTQFPDLHYHQTRIPFVNSVEKAVDTARRINAVEREEGLVDHRAQELAVSRRLLPAR